MANHDAELIDVLDDSGNPTGEKKTYNEIHRNGYRHRVMHVWLLDPEGELLLQLRAPDKINYPDMWDISFAGHIDSGEDVLDAAVREAKEEIGIDVKKEDMKFLFTVDNPRIETNNGTYIDHEFQDVYLIRLPKKIDDFSFSDREVAEVKWIPWQKLEEVIESGDPKFTPHPEEYRKLFDAIRALD